MTPRAALVRKLALAIAVNMLLFAGLLFAAAGTLDWWQGWVFLAVLLVGIVGASVGVLRADEALLVERLKAPVQKEQTAADKVILPALVGAFFAVLVLAPLDVFRLHWLARPNPALWALGLALFVAGWWIAYVGLRANAFAAPVVKIQAEREQRVVDSGPYGIVRHPMYAGGFLVFFGMPLWLESYAATLLALVPTALLVARILVEEGVLRRELPGYAAYMQRVRYRVIPHVW